MSSATTNTMGQTNTAAQPETSTQTRATRAERFVAAGIDAATFGVAMVPIAMLFSLIGLGSLGMVSHVLLLALSCAAFMVPNYKLLEENGQTLGKKLVKIKVVSTSTNEILPVKELLLKRYAPMVGVGAIPTLGAVLVIVNACMIFRDSENCFHDDLAQTKVIKA